jgi:UDP-N-acetylglucosamine transferase subunit ALG13
MIRIDLSALNTMTALLICSPGGHLAELQALAPRLGLDDDRFWVTFEHPTSRALLQGERVLWLPYMQPRDLARVTRSLPIGRRVVAEIRPDIVVTTGAGVALSFLPWSARRRIPSHFIDTATSISGPSLSARLARTIPGVDVYSQHRAWASRKWPYGGSVFDGYTAAPTRPGPSLERIVVTVGQTRYGFGRLIERLAAILPPSVEVLWQVGPTDVEGLGIEGRATVPADELTEAMERADVVVAHAGVGSALAALNAGRLPVLVPRRASRGEHVDEHQRQLAVELSARDLAVYREADDLRLEDLQQAAAAAVHRIEPPPFRLSRRTERSRA